MHRSSHALVGLPKRLHPGQAPGIFLPRLGRLLANARHGAFVVGLAGLAGSVDVFLDGACIAVAPHGAQLSGGAQPSLHELLAGSLMLRHEVLLTADRSLDHRFAYIVHRSQHVGLAFVGGSRGRIGLLQPRPEGIDRGIAVVVEFLHDTQGIVDHKHRTLELAQFIGQLGQPPVGGTVAAGLRRGGMGKQLPLHQAAQFGPAGVLASDLQPLGDVGVKQVRAQGMRLRMGACSGPGPRIEGLQTPLGFVSRGVVLVLTQLGRRQGHRIEQQPRPLDFVHVLDGHTARIDAAGVALTVEFRLDAGWPIRRKRVQETFFVDGVGLPRFDAHALHQDVQEAFAQQPRCVGGPAQRDVAHALTEARGQGRQQGSGSLSHHGRIAQGQDEQALLVAELAVFHVRSAVSCTGASSTCAKCSSM